MTQPTAAEQPTAGAQPPTRNRNTWLIIATCAAAAVLLMCCGGITVLALAETDADTTADTAETPAAATNPTTPPPAPSSSPTPTTPTTPAAPQPEPDPQQQLRQAVEDALGRSNRDLDRLVRVDADPDDPSQLIEIEWTINDNFTANLIRRGAQFDVIKLIEVVQQHVTWDYAGLRVIGTMALVDQFGNTNEREVINLLYSPERVGLINPQAVRPADVLELGEGAVHPEFRG